MKYQEHEIRVIEEKKELDKKIDKLTWFINSSKIFTELDQEEKYNLRLQLTYMNLYSDMLETRIKKFERH